MDSVRSEAFALLKPYCVQLTRDHSRQNIAQLFTALQSIDIVCLQDLQEYVIFPLRIILKNPKKCSQDLYLDLYTCMEYVLGHTKVTRWDLFQDIFHIATTMLSCSTDQTKVARLSEELKLAIIQTLRTLVKNSECSVIQQLYTILCLPLLGHSVSLLLNIAELDRARNLRVLAMECLLDFSQADSKVSQCMKADIGNTYASFLPGISVTLCKIITGDTKQGYAVTAKAIYVWMRIVSLVLDDKLLEVNRLKQANRSQEQNVDKEFDERLLGLIVKRNTPWVTSTCSNLCILVKQVASVSSHCNWRVRLGLVEAAEHLLLHCSSSMTECVPHFLEILVSLIGDEYAKVATGSRRALDLFTQSQAGDQQHRLTEILEENLHKLATSLPRQIQTSAEEEKIALLNLLTGYLGLLGGRVKNLLLSLPHLKRLSLAMLQILELECTDVKIVEERTTITGHGSSVLLGTGGCNISHPRKHFKLFHNNRIFEKLQGVCHLLGYYGDIHLLIDHFLDIFHETSIFKLQTTLVMNEIMLGTTGEAVCLNNSKNGRKWLKHGKDELDAVIRMLIDEYLNPANFNLVTSLTMSRGEKAPSLEQQLKGLAVTNTSPTKETTTAQMNKNIVQISLFLEGFGNFAKVLKTGYEPLLMLVLYPLLEKLGDETAYISNAAYIVLWDICTACKYKSLDELIRENTDYLMNAISLGLRHLERNKKCVLVLKVMLQYSSAKILPLVDDTLKEILASLDENYADESVLFMGVLNELTKAVVRWFPVETSRGIKSSTVLDLKAMPAAVCECVNSGSTSCVLHYKNNTRRGSYTDVIAPRTTPFNSQSFPLTVVDRAIRAMHGNTNSSNDNNSTTSSGNITSVTTEPFMGPLRNDNANNSNSSTLSPLVNGMDDTFTMDSVQNHLDGFPPAGVIEQSVKSWFPATVDEAPDAGSQAMGENKGGNCNSDKGSNSHDKGGKREKGDNYDNEEVSNAAMETNGPNCKLICDTGTLSVEDQSLNRLDLLTMGPCTSRPEYSMNTSNSCASKQSQGHTVCARASRAEHTQAESSTLHGDITRDNSNAGSNVHHSSSLKKSNHSKCSEHLTAVANSSENPTNELGSSSMSNSTVGVNSPSPASSTTYASTLPASSVEVGGERNNMGNSPTTRLKEYFSHLLKLESQAEGEITDQDLEDFNPEPMDTDDTESHDDTETKKSLPAHVTIVTEIMLRCKHIISSRNPRLRLLVLDTIGQICVALTPHRDELLPLIHKIWPPYSLCFTDEEKLVIIKAIEVLQTISESCGDFVRHRICKDVLPKLALFLQNQAQISVHAGSSYQFTVNFKLQFSILKHIGSIAKQTCIKGSDLDVISNSCLPYLHAKQPVKLQAACVDFCKELIHIDADVMWLKLCSVYTPRAYIPPDNRFIEIKALKESSHNNSYTSNVNKLLIDTTML